jgi:hypothetical protein
MIVIVVILVYTVAVIVMAKIIKRRFTPRARPDVRDCRGDKDG